MSTTEFVNVGTSDNFAELVTQQSHSCPVLVDFWADWCSPCKMLMPVLEKLATDYNGAFRLVKVNADEQQELAAQFGVRSLPTVKLFKDGLPVDEFMGALPESEVKAFLEKYVVNQIDDLARSAIALLEAGSIEEANDQFSRIFTDDPTHAASLLSLANYSLEQDNFAHCEQYLEKLSADDQSLAEVVKLKARLEMAQAGDGVDTDELLATVEADPSNSEARLKLGNAYIAQQKIELGLEQYLAIVTTDRKFGDDAGRSAMLNVFNMLEAGNPIVRTFRGKLARALN